MTADTEDLPQDLNTILSLDPMDLTRQDRDVIVAYQRKHRAQLASGVKTKKAKESGPTINIKELMGSIPKPAATPGSTIRRRL